MSLHVCVSVRDHSKTRGFKAIKCYVIFNKEVDRTFLHSPTEEYYLPMYIFQDVFSFYVPF